MKFRTIAISHLIIAFLCTLIIHCSNEREPVKKKKVQESDQQYSSIEFTEDLIIDRENWYPSGIEVDEEGNMYIFEVSFGKVFIYDKYGNEVDKKEFKEGQGPGDINFMDPEFSSDGNLYTLDKKIGRVTVFNNKWEIVKTQELRKRHKKFLSVLRLDSRNFIYLWMHKTHKFTKGKYTPTWALIKLSPSGRFIREIFEYRDLEGEFSVKGQSENIMYSYVYPPFGTFKLDIDDNLYYAVSDKYEINVISPQGELVRKITRSIKTRKVSEKDTSKWISTLKKIFARNGYKAEFIIPDRMPAIADFFVFENKYILVVTYENPRGSSRLKGDLFDNDGNFLTTIEVPKYWQWYGWGMLFKKSALYKNGYFNIVEELKDHKGNEKRIVKRYKINWN